MSDAGRIDLAHAPGFVLGRMSVRPSTRELVRDDGETEVLEPRVMQVLVALAGANGAIVTRDELSHWCWEGRIVGDDAINRVISRLRRSAEGIGEGSFRIETVTKVGYRLVREGGALPAADGGAPAASPRLSRRVLLLGAAGVSGAAAVAAGAALLWPPGRTAPQVSPRVAGLMQAGLTAVRQITNEGDLQARGLFRRVTELAPDYADGWGALAMVYGSEAHYHLPAEVPGLIERARQAIARAEALDPDNRYVAAAKWSLVPGNRWLEQERLLRAALRNHPDEDMLLIPLSRVLARVGRMGEAARTAEHAVAHVEASPIALFDLMVWQWSAGRLDDADRTIERARQLAPRHFAVWFGSFYIKLFSGRIDEAIAMGVDRAARPATVPEGEVERVLRVARAMKSGERAAVDAVMAELMQHAREAAGYAENAILFACALGRIDNAFAVAEAYFLDRGFSVPAVRFPRGQDTYTALPDRRTWYLFEPVAAPMRADPRFNRLTEDIGLARYWRESGSRPDYQA